MNINENNTIFSEVQGRHWNLTEVKKMSATVNIDRTESPIDRYTIKFESTHLTGAGAVNFYSASYVARQNHTLSRCRKYSYSVKSSISYNVSSRMRPNFKIESV